jgi:dienelactone hydrolase
MQGSTWTDHFPGNFMWSNATLACKGMAPYGAVALGEIDGICERLAARGMGDANAWWEEWSGVAARLEKLADTAAKEGRDASAGSFYLRAGNYFYTGERFVLPGAAKLAAYRLALRCYQEGLKRRLPNLEFVEVPYEGQSLPAYFLRAERVTGRAPTVVIFDGMDNCKEMSVLFAGLEFAKRGFSVLAIDGPGQGETVRLRQLYARHDYEVPGAAAYDYVASRPDVDPKKVVIMGYSFGGYYAGRIAAFEKRYCACVCLSALHWDLHAWQLRIKEQLKADPKKSAQSNFQFQWILGLTDSDAALERAKQFTLKDVAQKIACPILITHGEGDRVVPVDAAHKLFAALTTADKTLRVFTAAEGGFEHCHVDNRQLGVDFIADWIAARV